MAAHASLQIVWISRVEFERRLSGLELRAEGRKLSGVVMEYGDTSPTHRERFEPGSLRMGENIHLDLFHDVERVIAWHPGGGLTLTNGRDALTMQATLPPIPAASRALYEVRTGGVGGLSVEFKAERERRDGNIRVIERAILSGIGIVRSPSYQAATVEARRRKGGVPNPWIRAQWKARKSGACDCQGPNCRTVSFEEGAFSEALDGDDELLALAGSNRPLASRKKGTLSISETGSGDIELQIDRLAADTEIGRDLAGQAKATRVIARPWIRVEDSEFTETGSHRTFTKAALRGVIIKPAVADAGWDEVKLIEAERQASPARRSRAWL